LSATLPSTIFTLHPPTPHRARHFSLHDALPISLRIGDSSWRVLAAPARGGQFVAHHDRATAILAAGFSVTIFLAVYLGLASRNSDRKSTRLNSSHQIISYAVFCLKKKNLKYTNPILGENYVSCRPWTKACLYYEVSAFLMLG